MKDKEVFLPKDEKQRIVDYRKNYFKIQKNKDWLNINFVFNFLLSVLGQFMKFLF